MIKELNKTPIRTSNNYNINDLKIDIDIPKLNVSNNIQLITNENEKLEVNIDKEYNNILDTKIGLLFNK